MPLELRRYSDPSQHVKKPQKYIFEFLKKWQNLKDEPLFHTKSNLLCLVCWLLSVSSLLRDVFFTELKTWCVAWEWRVAKGQLCSFVKIIMMNKMGKNHELLLVKKLIFCNNWKACGGNQSNGNLWVALQKYIITAALKCGRTHSRQWQMTNSPINNLEKGLTGNLALPGRKTYC